MIREPVVVLDFETTGLRPERGDRVTEVGLVRIEGGRIVGRYQSLVNCGVRIPDCMAAYTGITQQMIDAAPPVGEVMREVAAFIGGSAVVAHNAAVDQRFFLREARRQRIGMLVEPFICTMLLAQRLYPHLASHSLGELAYRLNLRSIGRAHRAAADAELIAERMLTLGRDIGAMQPGANITPRVLRDLMRVPVAQLQTQLERLCA